MFQGAAYVGDLSKTELLRYSTFTDMFDADFKGVPPFIGEFAMRSKMYALMLGVPFAEMRHLMVLNYHSKQENLLALPELNASFIG